ncbi:hypothetical protein LTR95_012485 [Oleoguttula sp. CCFEE 5521]
MIYPGYVTLKLKPLEASKRRSITSMLSGILWGLHIWAYAMLVSTSSRICCTSSLLTDHAPGVESAAYESIGFAGNRYDSSGLALDGVTINMTKILGIGTKFLPGNKDSAVLHAFKGSVPFQRKIAEAANIDMVLYGADDRRAWFLDGASGLLHLSRAALTHARAPHIRKDFVKRSFRHIMVEDPPLGTASAVLLDETNRKLDLYGDGTYTFQHLVEGYLEVLYEILSHQVKLRCSATKQWQFRGAGKRRLEGFSFVDLLSAKPATQPRYLELKKSGSEWLPFVNKVGAVVLMGTNFGDLLEAKSTTCNTQQRVPKGLDLLGVPMARLRLISEEIGLINWGFSDIQLIEDIWWNEPHESFDSTPCTCTSQLIGKGCADHGAKLIAQLGDRRNKWYKGKRRALDSIFHLHPEGIVVFGHRDTAQKGAFRQPKHLPAPSATPVSGDIDSSNASQAGSSGFVDSGIGLSLSPSLTRDTQSSALAGVSRASSAARSTSHTSARDAVSARDSHYEAATPLTSVQGSSGTSPGSSVRRMPVVAGSGDRQRSRIVTPAPSRFLPSAATPRVENQNRLITPPATGRGLGSNTQQIQRSSGRARQPVLQIQGSRQQATPASVAAEPRTIACTPRLGNDDDSSHFDSAVSWQLPQYPLRPPGFRYKDPRASGDVLAESRPPQNSIRQ